VAASRLRDRGRWCLGPGCWRAREAPWLTVGYDAARFGDHSLRAGFPTATARAGVPEVQIMRSLPVLRGYTKGH
jgi:hypothetical protein